MRIADSKTLLVPGGLSEHASQLGFTSMSGLSIDFALAPFGLLFHHRHAGPIHLHIQNQYRLADHHRQMQLDRALYLFLLAVRDIRSDGFCDALHRFGRHLQAGQDPHLLAAMIERDILANQRLHAAHARRECGILDVQFHVGGELAAVAVWAR